MVAIGSNSTRFCESKFCVWLWSELKVWHDIYMWHDLDICSFDTISYWELYTLTQIVWCITCTVGILNSQNTCIMKMSMTPRAIVKMCLLLLCNFWSLILKDLSWILTFSVKKMLLFFVDCWIAINPREYPAMKGCHWQCDDSLHSVMQRQCDLSWRQKDK